MWNKKSAEYTDPTLREKEIKLNNKNFTTRFRPLQIKKEDFCYLCPYIEHFPPSFYDPGCDECPGEFDPDSQFCPRHNEWMEELKEEEEFDEIDETYTQKF